MKNKARSVRGIVYLVTNTKNGRRYVGITTRPLDQRIKTHKSAARRGKGSDTTLQEAIREFGIAAFTFEQIDEASTVGELTEKEIHYIEYYGTLVPSGYNQNSGGALSKGRELYVVEEKEYWGLAQLADAYGILEITMHKRMQSGRWTVEQACGLEPPPPPPKIPGKEVVVGGIEFETLTDAARYFGLDKRIVDMRLNRMGWSLDEAFGVIERAREGFNVGEQEFGTFKDACEHYDLNIKKVESRLRLGWTVEEAFDLVGRRPKPKQKVTQKPRKSVVIEGKEFVSLSQAADAYGIKVGTLSYRIRKGWTPDQAVGIDPPPDNNPLHNVVEFDGYKFSSLQKASDFFGVNVNSVRYRMKAGWTFRQCFELDPPPVKITKTA